MTIYSGRFANRTAIITGGASGLGLEAAKRITAEGGKVCLWDLNPEALADGQDRERRGPYHRGGCQRRQGRWKPPPPKPKRRWARSTS